MSERVLVIAAHPDDEVLGVGGTIARHVAAGDEVRVVVVADCESARRGGGDIALPPETLDALRCLGLDPGAALSFQGFGGMTLADREPGLSDIVGRVVRSAAPGIVYTHHPGDLNSDHRAVAQAVLVACRPAGLHAGPRRVLAFETPSSTEWGGASAGLQAFAPQVFVDVDEHLDTKLRAMSCYRDELRPPPHPRGLEALRARAAYWGQVSGCQYAEAFVLLREVVR